MQEVQVRGGFRPSDKGGGGHPDPRMNGGAVSKQFFPAIRASVWSKNNGVSSPGFATSNGGEHQTALIKPPLGRLNSQTTEIWRNRSARLRQGPLTFEIILSFFKRKYHGNWFYYSSIPKNDHTGVSKTGLPLFRYCTVEDPDLQMTWGAFIQALR